MKGAYQTVKDMFGGRETHGNELSALDQYLWTWTHVVFQSYPGELPESPYFKDELMKFSSYLANSNLIEFQGENDKRIRRHLTRGEYERVSHERLIAGTGVLLPYDSVKDKSGAFSTVFDMGKLDEVLAVAGEGVALEY